MKIKNLILTLVLIVSTSIFASGARELSLTHKNFKYVLDKKNLEFRVYQVNNLTPIHTEEVARVTAMRTRSLRFDESAGAVAGYRSRYRRTKTFKGFRVSYVERDKVSYNQVYEKMIQEPYGYMNLPVIPLQMVKFFGEKIFDFFVGTRSEEILKEGADFRQQSQKKPIHLMGIGVTGYIEFDSTKYTGLMRGGRFPIIGRLSLSQGNPFKHRIDDDGKKIQSLEKQPCSVAFAIKAFKTDDLNEKVVTANAVFQNDLNGEFLGNYLDGVLTNQPGIDFSKVDENYEWLTLLGVVKGTISNPSDRTDKFPFVNPQIRPIHQWTEAGESDYSLVKTPTWLKLQLNEEVQIVERDDFCKELYDTLEVNNIVYDIYEGNDPAKDQPIKWNKVGRMVFEKGYMTKAIDQNLLFFHSSLRSSKTGELIAPVNVPKLVRVE